MTHRGEIVEKVVRKMGYSLTKLARKLKISRRTLYNRFELEDLDYRFIVQVGHAIHYNFANNFPELQEITHLIHEIESFPESEAALRGIQEKYVTLLEIYKSLLAVLVTLANENSLSSLKEEINQFIEQENKIDFSK